MRDIKALNEWDCIQWLPCVGLESITKSIPGETVYNVFKTPHTKKTKNPTLHLYQIILAEDRHWPIPPHMENNFKQWTSCPLFPHSNRHAKHTVQTLNWKKTRFTVGTLVLLYHSTSMVLHITSSIILIGREMRLTIPVQTMQPTDPQSEIPLRIPFPEQSLQGATYRRDFHHHHSVQNLYQRTLQFR